MLTINLTLSSEIRTGVREFAIATYSRTPLIRTLVIRIVNYPDRLGPSGKSVENSSKLACLEITGYGINTVQCYGV